MSRGWSKGMLFMMLLVHSELASFGLTKAELKGVSMGKVGILVDVDLVSNLSK
jgi:hypothetical protein